MSFKFWIITFKSYLNSTFALKVRLNYDNTHWNTYNQTPKCKCWTKQQQQKI